MANEEHLAILKQGVEAWNKWRDENHRIVPDLGEANLLMENLSRANLNKAILDGATLIGADLKQATLSEATLFRATLSEATLGGANLSGAYLDEANLSGAYLSGANLSGAYLRGANLSRTSLAGADLSGAYLNEADLSKANLSHANLSRAILNGMTVESASMKDTILGEVDLDAVKGLEIVNHIGPSTLGIDTIYLSKGKIPEVFLRGCGVPDRMIAFIASLAGQPETNRVRLRMMIDEHFNKSELQTLCFDMDVDYDSLNGENKSDKARELVAYCERRQIIPDLVAKCKELRPKVSWEGEYE